MAVRFMCVSRNRAEQKDGSSGHRWHSTMIMMMINVELIFINNNDVKIVIFNISCMCDNYFM